MDCCIVDGWEFTRAEADRLADVAVAACTTLDPERRQIVAAILRDTIACCGAERILLGLAEPAATDEDSAVGDGPGKNPKAGVVAIIGPDDSANLLALGGRFTAEDVDSRESSDLQPQNAAILGRLLDMMHDWLVSRGISFCQAMRSPEAASPLLINAGYRKLATIDYMCAAVGIESVDEKAGQVPKSDLTSDSAGLQQSLNWQSYELFFGHPRQNPSTGRELADGRSAFGQLVDLVNETYAGSLDCPAIAEFRSTEAVLSGYRGAAEYDAASWLIASSDGGGGDVVPVGCLLLNLHPAGGSLEVTYMGLPPRWRGSGLASQFIRRAKLEALRLGTPHLTLAVDRENFPAIRLYTRHGFELLMSESVWGRKIGR